MLRFAFVPGPEIAIIALAITGDEVAKGKITKRNVDEFLPASCDRFLWDTELKGFGLKVTPTGRKVYVVQYRSGGGRSGPLRRYTIGTHGAWTPGAARKKAFSLLADVNEGRDPAGEKQEVRRLGNVSDLCDRFLSSSFARSYKTSTRNEIERIIEKRVKPGLGRHRLLELRRSHIREWHEGMQDTPYEANRALAYLSRIMSIAETQWEVIPTNLCKGVTRHKEFARDRHPSEAELGRIGAALALMEADLAIPNGFCIAVRLLALTGMRLGEVLSLRWELIDVADQTITLKDSKTGGRVVQMGAVTAAMLATVKREGDWLAASHAPEKPLTASQFHYHWYDLRRRAEITDLRPHDLRHGVGTYAGQGGANAFLVRDLLGHKTLAMTDRYVGKETDPLRAVANDVSARIAAAMQGNSAEILPFREAKK